MKTNAFIKPKQVIILFMITLSFSDLQGKSNPQPAIHTPDNKNIQYTGRIDFSNPKKPRLVGAGAYFEFKFKGTSCTILFEDQSLDKKYNYIAISIDGKYQGRIKVSFNKTRYEVAKNLKDSIHTLLVCKATEAMIGYLDFTGIECDEILPLGKSYQRKIEFIGNSITGGTGLDASEIPCDSGEWHDQHNAYLAYGPHTARALNANWLLSSVSGIGVSRNWNSEGPTMPEVYEHTYLDKNSSLLWNAKTYIPDLISICLGTNDFSDGDGSYNRKELDSARFVSAYMGFVKRIRERYPQAQICLLTSPVFSGDKERKLFNYLSAVKQHMQAVEHDNKIHLFTFSKAYSSGCTGHPNKEEHQTMAEELVPFYKRVMGW